MADGKTSLSFKWIAGAAVAAVIAGAGAVYVTNAPSGNGGTDVASAQCPANPARKAAMDAAATGEVAAFLVTDPEDLSPVAFQGPDGKAMTLADFKGKTILVNLWATWCAPCRKEMPALAALQDALGGDSFEVVTIATGRNPPPAMQAFFEEIGVDSLPLHRDPGSVLAREMGVLGLPITVILNPEGEEVARLRGDAEWDSESARAVIGALIGPEG